MIRGRISMSSLLALVAIAALAVGAAAWWADLHGVARGAWFGGTAVVAAVEGVATARAIRGGRLGVDAIALIAMVAALALGELFAGILVAVMMAGGVAIEKRAASRATRDLSRLISRAPRIAHVVRPGEIIEVPVDGVVPGDVVLVRAGEIVPVDGTLDDERAVLDESALTGESLPVERSHGEGLRSGVANAGAPFRLRATARARESTYAGVVRLVEEAQRRRAPFQRMADRYAAWLLPITLATAGAAWAATGDPVRALAVLVVATPCPLILAAPIALVSGISRAARRGVIVKGAEVIEGLGAVGLVLFDKTGTLTHGDPRIERISDFVGVGEDEILRLAASLDQVSPHALAEAIVHQAQERGIALSTPVGVREEPGRGVTGTVDGRAVVVGQPDWLERQGIRPPVGRSNGAADGAGRARVMVGVDGRAFGVIVLADSLRHESAAVVGRLRRSGVREVWLVTGDQPDVAEPIAAVAGVDRLLADSTPDQKLRAVAAARDRGLGAVMMVGDGINDAPALAAADVGLALGAGGATIASDTADAVVMVDRLDRVADAVAIGRRTLAIARQSVVAGMLMSLVAMGAAAAGFLPPAIGALTQEGIDLAVIANALRALGDGVVRRGDPPDADGSPRAVAADSRPARPLVR